MEKLLFIFLSIILCIQPLSAQTLPQKEVRENSLTPEQGKAFSEIQDLNLRLVKLYNDKKFDEALVIGKNILDIADKSGLMGNFTTLTAINNVSEVYLAKGNESEAIIILKRIAEGYEKIGDNGKSALEKTTKRMAEAYLSKNDYKNAEIQYIKLISLMESSYGIKNKKIADANLQLASIYNSQEKSGKAEQHYLKAIEINDAVLNEKEKYERKDLEIYKCFCYHRGFQQNNFLSAKKILEDLDKKRGIFPEQNLNKGIINGKAINLVRPKYPERAQALRAKGFAIVSVEIDEQGNVIKARTTCGFLEFVKEVESAAMASKFSPSLRNGVPIKVTGDIVYNFGSNLR